MHRSLYPALDHPLLLGDEASGEALLGEVANLAACVGEQRGVQHPVPSEIAFLVHVLCRVAKWLITVWS